MLFPENAGVIPWQQYEQTNPVLQHALRLLEEPDITLDKTDVADQVTQRLLGFPTLANTTADEERVLASRLTDHYHDFKWQKSDLYEFLTQETYLVHRGGEMLLCRGEFPEDTPKGDGNWREFQMMTKHLKPLSSEQKREILFDPEMEKIQTLEMQPRFSSTGSSWGSWGNRPLRDYNAFADEGVFSKVFSEVKASTKNESPVVMDLGGGIGLAVADIKHLQPEAVTINLTMDEEVCMRPADYMVISFMERMPLALQGKVDLIISNMATRYLWHHDRAVENLLECLTVGGRIYLSMMCCGSSAPTKHIKARMKKAYELLQTKAQAREIKLDLSCYPDADQTLYPAAWLDVTRLK